MEKIFRTTSTSAVKTSRGGLGVTKVHAEKVSLETPTLRITSSAFLLGQRCTAASRTDFLVLSSPSNILPTTVRKQRDLSLFRQ
jgi:hypothetical protein